MSKAAYVSSLLEGKIAIVTGAGHGSDGVTPSSCPSTGPRSSSTISVRRSMAKGPGGEMPTPRSPSSASGAARRSPTTATSAMNNSPRELLDQAVNTSGAESTS